MPNELKLSRRGFLQSSGAVTGASLLKLTAPSLLAITQAACSAKQEGAAFAVLETEEAADFAAIAARIFPTSNTPGANEAGVIHFFDRALAAEMSASLTALREGLTALNASVAAAHSDQHRFARISEEDQDAMLRDIEDSDFFLTVHLMTLFGFFGMSQHGGNQNNVGWKLVGFEGHHGPWQYPFGYYDAEYAKEQSHGE